jgi:hypothetical protein
MLKHFLQYLMFGLTMFAAAPSIVGGGDGGAGGAGDGGGEGAGGGAGAGDDLGQGSELDGGADLGEDGDALDGAEDLSAETLSEEQRQQQERDKETSDFKGLVSKRLVALKKEAPELTQIFQKHPKVQEQVEAAFRRDMAYRELYPTIAEARQMREQFPNGMADVEQLMTDLGEVEQLDKDFQTRDAQGNYAGHSTIVQNMFQQDRDAAVALFRTLPKEWARLDPESYSEVMGSIVGATLARAELPEWITELRDAAKEAKQDGLATSLDKMLRWASGFLKRKVEPTEDERRVQGQREQLRRETESRKQEDFGRFRQSFTSESKKLQESIIRKHPAIDELYKAKNLTDQKKAEIVEKVRKEIEGHLKSSRAFMAKLRPAYNSGNLRETIDLQRVAWSYPWVLNKFVRKVMAQETPNLVRRPGGTGARAATSAQRQPVNRGTQPAQRTRTEPYKENGVWHSKEGRRLTTSEILRGAVPDHLLNAK